MRFQVLDISVWISGLLGVLGVKVQRLGFGVCMLHPRPLNDKEPACS